MGAEIHKKNKIKQICYNRKFMEWGLESLLLPLTSWPREARMRNNKKGSAFFVGRSSITQTNEIKIGKVFDFFDNPKYDRAP